MRTSCKSGIHKPKTILSLNVECAETKPTSFQEAFKRLEWKVAMTDEYNTLISDDTWDLIPPRPY